MITITDSTRTKLDNFDIELLPPDAFQYLKIHKYLSDKKTITIEAGPYVGLIPLLNGDTIYIAPRIGNSALTRMLSVVNNFSPTDNKTIDSLGSRNDNPVDWLQMIGSTFKTHLETIETRGLRFTTQKYSESLQYVKGTINYRKTTLGLARNSTLPIVSVVKRRSYSTPENNLLGVAATIVNRGLYASKNPLLSRWSTLTGQPHLDIHDYETVVQNINKGVYDDYRSYYKPALKIALLLIPENVAGIDFNDNSLSSNSFVSNINILYEEYIRTVITRGLLEKGMIAEKPKNNLTSLFTDGGYRLIPDVLITKNGSAISVGDMKYKPREETVGQDWYQLKTYMDAHNLGTGFLVRPTAPNTASHSKGHTYFDGKKVLDISLNISDYYSTEKYLLEQLNSIVS